MNSPDCSCSECVDRKENNSVINQLDYNGEVDPGIHYNLPAKVLEVIKKKVYLDIRDIKRVYAWYCERGFKSKNINSYVLVGLKPEAVIFGDLRRWPNSVDIFLGAFFIGTTRYEFWRGH